MMSTVLHEPRVSSFLGQDRIPAFLGGSWKTTSAGEVDVIDPSTGQAVTRVCAADAADVNSAVEAAHQAFASWSTLSPSERAVYLHRLADLIESHAEVLAQLESIDVGKPINNARGFDVPFGAECLRYFADLI